MSNQYDNTNTGVLFVNDKKGNEKRPDRRGSINIEGREFWLSGWLGEKNGKPYLKLKAEAKDEQSPPQTAHNQAKANGYAPQPRTSPGMPTAPPQTPDDSEEDTIPF